MALTEMAAACVVLLASCGMAFGQIEAPEAPFQTRPWPADGETLNANPPAFVWLPAGETDEHVLQYSRDAGFPAAATTSARTPWLIHVPTETLEAGEWYWRWQPAGADEWSPVRRFTIAANAVDVPFPDVSAAAARLGAARPRVIVTADELDEVRAWAEATQQPFLDQVRRDAERALEEDLLPEPEFLPPRGDPEWGPVYVGIFRTTRPVFGRMSRLAEGYLLSGDETMGRAAARLLMNFLSWDPEGSTSLGHNDEPATEFVRYCPRVYDWVHPLLTDDERRTCREVMATRMAEMYARWERRPFERYPYESHNMGYYLPDLTEACIAMAGEMDVEEMLRYCMLQLWSPYYPPYGGDDGGWQEGPPYWGWVADVFARLCVMVEKATGAQVAQRSSLRNQAYFKLYANPPYAKMSPFGDGQSGPSGGGTTMFRLASLYRNPYALWFARQKNVSPSGLEAWMWDVSDLEPREPIDLPQGRCFPSVGEAAMHTALWSEAENVQLLFRSCPFGGISHAYADQNTFSLDAFGEPLVIASGYYPYYGSPHHVEWSRKTAASNSVLVNGQGQERTWDAKGEVTTFETSPNADYVVGDATLAYPGLLNRFLRKMLFVRPLQTGGPTIIAIHDDLEAEEPSTFQWLLHSLQEMEVGGGEQRVLISRGDVRCRADFLLPKGLELTQTDQFTVPPETGNPNQWHLTASAEEKSASGQSLIVLVPYRNGEGIPEVETVEGNNCVAARLAGAGAEHVLLFRTGDGEASVESLGIGTDAEAAAVTLVDGEVRASFAAGGNYLSVGGTRLAMPTDGAVLSEQMASESVELAVDGGESVSLPAEAFPLVRRVRYSGDVAASGHHEVTVRAKATNGPVGLTLAAGGTETRWALEPGAEWQELTAQLVELASGGRMSLTVDGSLGGTCEVEGLRARRVYGRDLLVNGGYEEADANGKPRSWQAGSITNGATCEAESVDGGRDGGACLKITCTKAGGDFGVSARWPGVAPVDHDRRFRFGLWVKNGPDSDVGIQVTDQTWHFFKNTERLTGCAEWTESVAEFVLPAGEDLTNVRLHMRAETEGAVMYADDAHLIELAPE